MSGYTVLDVERVERVKQGNKHGALRCTCVDGQRGGSVVADLQQLRSADGNVK